MQHILHIPFEESYAEESFILSCSNLEAYQSIMRSEWPYNRLLIIGAEGSGKTHLINIWRQYQSKLNRNNYIVLENIEQYAANETYEKQLLYTINLAIEYGAKLIMSTRKYEKYSLSDLNSRLNATYTVLIRKPDEYLLKNLLMKRFYDLQICVPYYIIEYIAARIERSFTSIKSVVEQINTASLVHKHQFTVPFIRKVLIASGIMNDDSI